ncbi:iron complex outermembrane receptor protein [Povalibacter uvarum]|uniref:Iron complex outermembrane receptor protein n=1 Tax=Povalibacter uvarum TaxID=732238 RepID=A0A841HGV4_9GAMM|nr:TonB-dependent receptor [Povalibacter uvarum]MBB6092147.1 iron complex outermembrane receptor protein [Povalibacter uvarum]
MKKVAALLALPALAHGSMAGAEDGTFTLGEITVTATRVAEDVLTDAIVDRKEIWSFNRSTLDEAVKLVAGVTSTFDSNGRRNEHDILVRGYGRWQVPLSIDGIRVYLPADNRLDFSRFLTDDLAQIQIQKGYASVIDGPGGLGGAINLVTRKPTEKFEGEVQAGLFGADSDDQGWLAAARVGTRQHKFYAQASGSYLDRDHWSVSDDFQPTAIEDGGERNGSDNRDWRVNAKVGFTPNETDEYSLSYTSQSGSKGAPLNVFNNPPNPPNSYWRWPWWDIENLYWLSNTQLGSNAYLKTRLFYNTFDNALYAYDNATYATQSANGRFRSIYDDTGYGGSIEAGMSLTDRDTLRAVVHYRRDKHTERNYNRPTHPTLSSVEPLQETLEDTWSVALENTFKATAAIDVVLGISYDKNDLKRAQEYNTTQALFGYPTGGSDAVNAQGAVHWRYADGARLYGSISSRTRFPTIFERYSTRFGTAVPNPDLESERGTNYEIGWEAALGERSSLSAAIFYNDVADMIQTVVVSAGPPQLTQAQNVGDGEYYGIELSGDAHVLPQLRVGGNYTYLERRIVDPLQPNFRPTGTPSNQAFLFLAYQPWESFTITPSVEIADDRWSDVTGGGYIEVGSYTLANLQFQYAAEHWEVAVGGRNLADENYQLAYGYPEQGRTWFAKFKAFF